MTSAKLQFGYTYLRYFCKKVSHSTSLFEPCAYTIRLDMNRPKKILLIRRDNIGDLVCTTPALAALRQNFPGSEIGALVNSYNADVLLGNPNVDHVFVYQKLKHANGLVMRFQALWQRLKLIIHLRRWKPDVTILAKASFDRHGLKFARFIGAKNIVGYVPEAECMVKDLPDIRLKTPEFISMHEVEAVAGLLKPLGVSGEMGPLQVFPAAGLVARVRESLPKDRFRIALHISAREPERRWGSDNFIKIAKHILVTQPKAEVWLFWSPGNADDPHHPGDDVAAEHILKAVDSDRLMPMATNNISELVAALSVCNLIVCADGGAMHVGVALNIKTLAMFENRSDKLNHWYPWKVTHRIVTSRDIDLPEISQIDQQDVVQAFDSLGC